jgi:hypothetical protein
LSSPLLLCGKQAFATHPVPWLPLTCTVIHLSASSQGSS